MCAGPEIAAIMSQMGGPSAATAELAGDAYLPGQLGPAGTGPTGSPVTEMMRGLLRPGGGQMPPMMPFQRPQQQQGNEPTWAQIRGGLLGR